MTPPQPDPATQAHAPAGDTTRSHGTDPPGGTPSLRTEWHSSGAAPAGLPSIPGYEVTAEIARGGMGRVLAARELALDREVAIKVLLPGAKADRFVTESKITARLPHPNIPPVHALGTLPDGSPFLAMKLVRGRTLADELKARAEPAAGLSRLVQVFEGICQAVGFAHAQGILHRDLKPANVMVGAFGEVQVMDWGLAKLLTVSREAESAEPSADAFWTEVEAVVGGHTRAGTIMGTPAYMAPEQARGEAVDARADVFALGGILTAILTGKAVFAGKTSAEVLQQAAAGDTADALARLAACGADTELVAVATTCLAVEAASRPADGRAVAERVAAYRAGVESRLRQAESARAASDARAVEERKRRRVMRIGSGVIAGVLLTGIGATSWQAWRAWKATGVAVIEAANARTAEGLADKRATAEAEARKLADAKNKAATAAKAFLQDVLVQGSADGQASKERVANPKLLLREALDYAAKGIEGKFADQPEIDADLRNTIGWAYSGLAAYEAAQPHLTEALRLRETAFARPHPLRANHAPGAYQPCRPTTYGEHRGRRGRANHANH